MSNALPIAPSRIEKKNEVLIQDLKEKHEASHFVELVRKRVAQVVVGQDIVVERLLIALFTGGHLLLQGMPGLAENASGQQHCKGH